MNSNRVRMFIFFTLLFWYSASGFLYFELQQKPDLSWADAIWWAIVTMTTVGYGDFFPITDSGRFFVGIPAMIFGIGFLGYIITELAAYLLEFRSRRLKGMQDIKWQDHIIIINFSRLDEVQNLILELKYDDSTKKQRICLVDEFLNELPHKLVKLEVQFIKGNPTEEDVLKHANLGHASHVIVLSRDRNDPHSDDQNLVTSLVIEKLNPKIFSIIEILNPKKIRQVELTGANSVVCASEFTSNLIIQELQDPGVKDIVMEITSNKFGQQIYINPVQFQGDLSYKELILWGLDNKVSILGIMRDGKPKLNCPSREKIQNNDKAICIGGSRFKKFHVTM